MKALNYVDKSSWDDGPWKSEPDKAHWIDEATGLDCLIVRGPHGGLCGYVGVPESHPHFGKDYDKVDAEVHGGLTFADTCQESKDGHGICHTPEPGRPDKVWWLGFDCAHSGDRTPAYERLISLSRYHIGDTYKNFEYVRTQCGFLARQLNAAAATNA